MSPTTQTTSLRTLYVGAFVVLIALGVRATFGLFMQPMGLANGWGRDVFSLAFAIQNIVWGVGAIFMGILADRYGSAARLRSVRCSMRWACWACASPPLKPSFT